jgi:N-methylhydantoinase A
MARYSLGIDIGGTFTDIVVYDHDQALSLSHKELTTPAAPAEGVLVGIRRLFGEHRLAYRDVVRVVHATTLFTNALIERKGAPTGLITTEGFRDTLEMSREHKYDLYDLFIELPRPLVRRSLRLEVRERVNALGQIETPLDTAGVLAAADRLKKEGVTSVAIAFLHAYANATHERAARDAIRAKHPELFVSISSEVSPQIREYERTSTTVANAYVKPLADSYLDLMSREIAGLGIPAPLFMMLSNGGLTHVDEAKRAPIQLLESGPAAGALAGSYFGTRAGTPDVLAFDMGGTTAKLAMVLKGQPLIAYSFEASREKRFAEGSGLPINISTIELIEIGAGGGSIAAIDALALLKVGPHSAGAAPGPACYGRGGTQPTVTDANLVLGYLDAATFAGGTIAIDHASAVAAIEPLAKRAGLSIPELAWGIHSVVNENMAAAARVHIAERGHHAGEFALLVTGGGGPLHGCEVARRLGIGKLVCPPSAGVASALGLLMAPARIDRVATVAKRLSGMDWPALEAAYVALEQDAHAVIAATLAGNPAVKVERAADMRFVGQGFEVVTVLPAGPYTAASASAIRTAFETEYRKVFGLVPPAGEVEIINVRVAVTADAVSDELKVPAGSADRRAEPKARRQAWSGADQDFVEMPVYDRYALGVGAQVAGPAIVEEASSTLILPRGSTATVKPSGSLVVDLPAAGA